MGRSLPPTSPEIDFRIWPDIGDPLQVRFLAAWEPPDDLAARFPHLQVLFSSGAGVDQFDLAALPPALPVVRMVEPGIVRGMVEYVTQAVLSLHRDLPAYRRQQQAGEWRPLPVRPADERRVGVLGLGSLGQAVLTQLQGFGFDCAGWSRSRRAIDGVRCYAGQDELPAFLARTELLVCLLPLTDATRGVLNGGCSRNCPGAPGWCTWAGARSSSTMICWPRWSRASWATRCWTWPTPSRCRPRTPSGAIRASSSRRTSPA